MTQTARNSTEIELGRIRLAAGRQRGFTLAELLVSAAIMTGVVVAILAIFMLNTKTARFQTRMAQMQQSARVAQSDMTRTTRMAGRGGIPRGLFPDTLAVAVRNDVPAGGDESYIAVADSSSPEVVEGTDVLTVRGVFATPIYQINTAAGTMTLDSVVDPTSGTIRIQSPNPETGVPQDLSVLEDALDAGTAEALVIVSAAGDEIYAVVEFDTSANTTIDERDDVIYLGGDDSVDFVVDLDALARSRFEDARGPGVMPASSGPGGRGR